MATIRTKTVNSKTGKTTYGPVRKLEVRQITRSEFNGETPGRAGNFRAGRGGKLPKSKRGGKF